MNWVIIPYLDCPEYTEQAVLDVFAMRMPDLRILLVNNGSQTERGRAIGHHLRERYDGAVFLWNYDPALPALSSVWNGALDFVWTTGETHALVINNDVRLHPDLYAALLHVQQDAGAWFVTACNVGEDGWKTVDPTEDLGTTGDLLKARGGPDFSCFLITAECHRWFQFDEGFQPAYFEDNDFHRRLTLAGFGERIFSVCVPYLHYGSGTLKQNPRLQETWAPRFGRCREYYLSKWGGEPHHETYTLPFDGQVGPEHDARLALLGQGRNIGYPVEWYQKAAEVLYGRQEAV